MNNLEKFDSQELTISEMREINGGFICGGVCIVAIAAGAAFITGVGIGVALYNE
ncbi:MAG TPA: hypothetical protein VD908_16950 [Cytophagales bacterium]|nr:hypothetical protein [Cytophagales bacterium]